MENNYTIGGGLTQRMEDKRDFKFGSIFSLPKLVELPKTGFHVAEPMSIKNQDAMRADDFCTGYALSSVMEDADKVPLNPIYMFAAIKEIAGDVSGWGADLRSAAKAACKIGTIAEVDFPFKDTENVYDLRDMRKFPKELKNKAAEYKKKAYFEVDGQHDLFDNMRATLWANRGERRSILTGALWRNEWTYTDGGILPSGGYTSKGFGHAFKVFGQEIKNGEMHLCLQLSNGDHIGNKGIFYAPRALVNSEFTFGSYTFKDLSREDVEYMLQYGIKANDNWLTQFFKTLLTNFKIYGK